jgi:flagellar biosynthesis GTPase FlhF
MTAPKRETERRAQKVYISYSRESDKSVKGIRDLSSRLREHGIDSKSTDQLSSSQDWLVQAEKNIRESDFVLVVFTEPFDQTFEAALIKERFYGEPTFKQKFIPAVLQAEDRKWIPEAFQTLEFYDLSVPTGFDNLLRLLTGRQASTISESVAGEVDQEAESGAAATFESLKESDFTDYAWSVLEAARRMGDARPRPSVCSMVRLMTALLLSGMGQRQGAFAGAWLMRQTQKNRESLRRSLEARYPILGKVSFSFAGLLKTEAVRARQMTGHLKDTLDLAQQLADRNSQSKVGARHLLGAALFRKSRPGFAKFLHELGLEVDALRDQLLEDLPGWRVDDNPDAWRQLLDPHAETPTEQGLPAYLSDSAEGPDLIGITREVEAMASLVSAWSVEPPLSIGLFGEWGSGKSFFMQKMKERVAKIASESRKSGLPQRKFGYYRNIVQVEFNAWHYVEGNLWASLVEHIFTNLRLVGIGDDEKDIDSEEQIQKRLEKLLGQIKEKTLEVEQTEKKAQTASLEAEERKSQAEAAALKLESEAKEARERAQNAEEEGRAAEQAAVKTQLEADASAEDRLRIGMKDVVEELEGSAEIRAQVEQDLATLGFTRDRLATVQGLRDVLREASETTTLLSEGVKIVREDNRRWLLLVWIFAVPVITAAGIWGGAWLLQQQDSRWLQSILGIVSSAATVVGVFIGFWKRYSPKLKPILTMVGRLKEKRAVLEKQVEEGRQRRAALAAQHDETVQSKRRQAAEQTQLAAQKAAEAEKTRQQAKDAQDAADRAAAVARNARAEADRLQQDAGALRPERRIAAFIQDRARATDYRRHLGVPALIRRDFEKLSGMFRTQRKGERKREDVHPNDLAIVNRIILYIDDLDRCPPEKVVEVLRAIHLLLAFPLFVVIVAVDARWMKRSLKERFSLMLNSQEATNGNRPESQEEDLALGRTATPDDYLEKIFQVPFWIRPLGKKACENLVNALSAEALDDHDDAANNKDDAKLNDGAAKPPDANVKGSDGAPAGDAHNTQSEQRVAAEGQTHRADVPEPAHANGAAAKRFTWSNVEPRPHTLQLTREEREYMIELAQVIGRSPRSVKRFVNCYRLLKSTLDKDELARASHDGTFRATMLLLALVTGLPQAAPQLLSELKKAEWAKTPSAWVKEVIPTLQVESRQRKDLESAFLHLKTLSNVNTLRPLVQAAARVDRFSFSPVRSVSEFEYRD